MIRFLIPVVLLLIGLAGGIAAGFLLASDRAPDVVDIDEHADDASDDHSGDEAQVDSEDEQIIPASDGFEYVRLNNQFIVPIVRNSTVRSLVVISLTIEVPLGLNEAVFDHEPRLRDTFLRVMFAHANAGGFDGSFTEAAAMAPLREGLREAAAGVLGPVVRDVLIVDITRQDA